MLPAEEVDKAERTLWSLLGYWRALWTIATYYGEQSCSHVGGLVGLVGMERGGEARTGT